MFPADQVFDGFKRLGVLAFIPLIPEARLGSVCFFIGARIPDPFQTRPQLLVCEFKGKVTARISIPKPNDNLGSVVVDLKHLLDLMPTFSQVGLIDADGVYPQPFLIFFTTSSLPQMAKNGFEVTSNPKRLAVEADSSCRCLVSPHIRDSLVGRLGRVPIIL